MSTQVQLRRGSTTDHNSFTGAVAELTVDTTKKTVVVHDGTTAGGVPLAKESTLSSYVPTSAIGSTVQAYNANTAVTNTAQSFTAAQRAAITTLTDATNISVDFSLTNNFVVTLGGNRTLDNPTNQVAGQSGSIFIVQDSGSRTLAYGSNYDFAGGTAPTLSTAANAVDRIDYIVRASGSIHCVFTANYS